MRQEQGRYCRSALRGDLSYRSLDVHRRCREPELNLHPGSTSEAGPSQAMQFLCQAEGPFDAGLPLCHAPLTFGASYTVLGCLDEV